MLSRWLRAIFDLVVGVMTGPEFHHAGTVADIGSPEPSKRRTELRPSAATKPPVIDAE